MFCKHCGNPIDADSVYCPICGKNQNSGNAQPAPLRFGEQDRKYQENNQNRPPISVNFFEAIKNYYSNFANFSGRAVRSEYWWVYLYNFIVGILLNCLPKNLIWLTFAWSIIHLLPGVAICIRRLHDVDKSGGFYFICLIIPIVGPFMLLYHLCKNSSFSDNIWGLSPYNISPEYDETKTWKCEECGERTPNSKLSCKNCGAIKPSPKPHTHTPPPSQKSKKCVCGEIVYGYHCPNCGREL